MAGNIFKVFKLFPPTLRVFYWANK